MITVTRDYICSHGAITSFEILNCTFKTFSGQANCPLLNEMKNTKMLVDNVLKAKGDRG